MPLVSPPLPRNRDFVLLETGLFLSNIGTGTANIAYPLLVLAVTHSAAKTGVVSFAQFLPYVLFGLAAGVAADRWQRKRLMVAADATRALAVGGLAALIALHRLSLWTIIIVGFVEGTGAVFYGAAHSGAFRAVVPRRQLSAAASTEEGRRAVQRLMAPPLGGALFGLGRAIPFILDAASYACSTAAVLLMRTPFEEERKRAATHPWHDAVEGLRFVWANPFLRLTTLMFALGNISSAGIQISIIIIARRQGLSGTGVGALVALVGATTLIGSLVSALVRRVLSARAILLSEFWAGLALVSFLVRPNAYVLGGAFAFQAFFFVNTDSTVAAYRYALTPDRLIARVTTGMFNVAVLATPLGPLAAGFLIGSVSPRAAVAGFLALLLIALISGTLSKSTRGLPPPADLAAAEAQT
jgi:MFS family permease